MRKIINDSETWQVQHENGIAYYYRKDYLREGDGVLYSLALMFARDARHSSVSGIFPAIDPPAGVNGASPEIGVGHDGTEIRAAS